jgi:hypothetical protein
LGYLKCEECNGTYELKEGESPEEFETCECGGKLKYTETLSDIKPDKKDEKTPIPTNKPKSDASSGDPDPKKRKKYMLIGLVAVIFIIAIIGGYYAYGQYQENSYYENYRLQLFNGNQAWDKLNASDNTLTSYNFDTMTMAEFNEKYSEIIGKLDQSLQYDNEASSFQQKAIDYQNKMLNSAKTDYQKKYAESLLKQSDLRMKVIDLYIQADNLRKDMATAVKNNDVNKVNEINKQITELRKQVDDITNQITKIVNEREDIRASNPDFTARLNKEAETAANATI